MKKEENDSKDNKMVATFVVGGYPIVKRKNEYYSTAMSYTIP